MSLRLHINATVFALLSSSACTLITAPTEVDDTTPTNEVDAEAVDAGDEKPALQSAYLLMHTVSSPEGRQNYVYVVPDLEVGDLDDKQGMEVSGASRSFVLDGKVYVADGETFIITSYDVNEALELEKSGELSLVNHGLSYFDTGWTFVNEERAYYMNSEQLEVIVWDPTVMEITDTIDLSSLKDDKYPNFYADGGTKSGDRLYSMFWNYDENGGPYDAVVSVAVIDTKQNKLLSVTRDDRCAMAWPGTTLPNGDFYIVGNAAGIGYQFDESPPAPNCLLRIKKGDSEFDPDFVQYLDDLTQPLVGGSTFQYANELNRAVVWSTEAGDFADKDDFFTNSTWRPVLIDPTDWSATHIEDVSARGWMGETFVVDGSAFFTVGANGGTSGERTGSALVRYEDGELTEMIRFGEWLQVLQRIR